MTGQTHSSDPGLAPKAIAPSPHLAPAVRKRVQACYEQGAQLAAKRQQADYAHDLFSQCVLLDPGNPSYAEALLANLRTKFDHRKYKAGRWTKLGGGHGIKKAISKQDWSSALQQALEQLKGDPWHVTTLRGLAEACAGLHWNETELVYLKQALEADPKDAETNRHCARSLTRMGKFDQAIACWHRVETIHPGDKEVAQMIAKLSEERLWHAADRREQAGKAKPRPALEPEARNEAAAEEVPQVKAVTLSQRQLLEKAIAESPQARENYLQLAELFFEQKRLIDAADALERCLAACGNDPRVRDRLAEIKALIDENAAAAPVLPSSSGSFPWLELMLILCGCAFVLLLLPSTRLRLLFANVAIAGILILLRGWQQKAAGAA